jgi:ribosomal protein L16 Arg81 hydroxylase
MPLKGICLPSQSSGDLSHDEIGKPMLEVTLRPGDVLYLPRGFVHEAISSADEPSAHLTLSSYQQWSWFNLTERVLDTCYAVRHHVALDELQDSCHPTQSRGARARSTFAAILRLGKQR